MIYYGNLN